MSDNDIRKNGSGYFDPTAYQAIKNIERNEKPMVITDEKLEEIREKISHPCGRWNHLPLDVRTTIKALVRSVDVNRSYSKSIASLPNCNDCAIMRDCKFCPKWGEPVRINCPFHVEKERRIR